MAKTKVYQNKGQRRFSKSNWNPYTSKWKAALEKGLDVKINGKENILYLGASTGTTISHISNQTKGLIFGVEVAPLMAIPLIRLAEKSNNLCPILADARNTELIKEKIYDTKIDILFQDIPSRDQIKILENASKIVDKDCKIFLSLKTQSISQKNWRKTADKAKKELQKNFKIMDSKIIEPFHQKHVFFILKKK